MTMEESLSPSAVTSKYCFACGKVLDARAEICPGCGVRQAPATVAGRGAASVPYQATGAAAIAAGLIAIVAALLGSAVYLWEYANLDPASFGASEWAFAAAWGIP